MAIVRNDYPILEYDTGETAMLNPDTTKDLPRLCLMTSFGEILNGWIQEYGGEEICHFFSEMREFPVYRIKHRDIDIAVTQLCEGAGMAATQADFLLARGVEVLMLADSCGLLRNTEESLLYVPHKALRDEGASYKYLKPSRFVELPKRLTEKAEEVIRSNEVAFESTDTWTLDSFYRATPEMVAYRKEEGFYITDKSVASIAAVAEFRKKEFACILCGGYRFEFGKDESMDLSDDSSARIKTFCLTLDTLSRL